MTERVVYIVSDPADSEAAERLAARLTKEGFAVHHGGNVSVGDSRIADATRSIQQGIPFVICATANSLARRWTHMLAQAAHAAQTSQVFVVQMEPELYVDQLALNRVVADYWRDPDKATADLVAALMKLYPDGITDPADVDPLGEYSYLDT